MKTLNNLIVNFTIVVGYKPFIVKITTIISRIKILVKIILIKQEFSLV